MTTSAAKIRILFWLSALWLGAATVAWGQDHLNQARGARADSTFSGGSVDAVNLFNGALSLNLGFGGSYPGNGTLTYGVGITYNTNLWKYVETSNATWNGGDAIEAIVDPEFNAGFGWTLSLGRLFSPSDTTWNDSESWVYVAPDGARHQFYPTLHENETGYAPNPNFQYSRDGSYLRLDIANRLVEMPNGIKCFFSGSGPSATYLTKMEDRFTNSLDVSVTATQWTLTDEFNRSHTITFADQNPGAGVSLQVSQINLAAFNGQRAVYTFSYEWATIKRTTKDTWLGNNTQPGVPTADDPVAVALLKQIDGPEGVSWRMLEGTSADYHRGEVGQPRSLYSGLIESLDLPTRGKMAWAWRTWIFPAGVKAHRNTSPGVASKTVTDPTLTSASGTWTYSSQLFPTTGAATELIATVADPAGFSTRHYFTARAALPPVLSEYWDYGLPFTSRLTTGGRFLSTERLDAVGNVERSQYVTFTRDKLSGSSGDSWNTNRRSAGRRVVFGAVGNDRWIDTATSDFDGLGHYRTETTSGKLTAAAAVSRSETMRTNPLRGCYEINLTNEAQLCTGSNTFDMFDTTDKWVLGTYSDREQMEGGETARQEYTFNPDTGFLQCMRLLRIGTTRSTTDLLTIYTQSLGNVTTERTYGGDTQPLTTGAGCAAPTQPAYQMLHAYQNGVLATSKPLRPNGTDLGFFTREAIIDLNTGLDAESKDSSGFRTRYTYDRLGRPTLTEALGNAGVADDGATSVVTYFAPSGTTGWRIQTAETCPAGASGCAPSYGETDVLLDGFGRTYLDRFRRPSGLMKRRTERNALGWTTRTSTWIPNSSGNGNFTWTTFENFDPFGRPTRSVLPDGKVHTFAYDHVREVARTATVATDLAGNESNATTLENYDPFGRLIQVSEPALAGGGSMQSKYFYDVGNRLRRVEQIEGATTQVRTFTYDQRGFLLSESHPEKGGAVTYLNYDAHGHAGERRDGSAASGLLFTYDAADRPLTISETATSGGRALKQFTYDTGSGFGLGQLATAVRWNYLPAPINETIKVTEAYSYEGVGGAISARSTQLERNGVGIERFDQTFGWDRGGEIATLGYPRCFNGSCSSTGTVGRTIGNTREYGHLLAVTEGATNHANLTYHPHGGIATVVHGNGVVDMIADDPAKIGRPGSITAVGAGSQWTETTGAYQWDGMGNIKAMGNDHYAYDRVSRLVDSQVTAMGAQHRQQYSFDGFGNLGSVTTTLAGMTPTTRNIPITAATNRLATPSAYDLRGNLTSWNGATYTYDHLQATIRITNGAVQWSYAYTADDERIYQVRSDTGERVFTVRDLDGKLLREYAPTGGVTFDYLYRDGLLTARIDQAGTLRHMTLDHLGTPRWVSNALGGKYNADFYFPFGEEIQAPAALDLRFTGHERDFLETKSTADDIDYMMARFCSPLTGRFLSFDPVGGNPRSPQSWNRFAYVVGNPLKYTDPTGMFPAAFVEQAARRYSSYINCASQGGCGVDFITIVDVVPTANALTGLEGLFDLAASSQFMQSLGGEDTQGARGLRILSSFLGNIGRDQLESMRSDECVDMGDNTAYCGIVVMGAMPGPPAKKAVELVSGKLKRSKSYSSHLENYTRDQLQDMARKPGPFKEQAKKMLKLIKDAPRLHEKNLR